MPTIVPNVFSEQDLAYFSQLPEVLDAFDAKKSPLNVVYFSITLTDTIRNALQTLGLDLSNVSKIPMRYIKGDTPQHIDHGASTFENTYLIYLNDSSGSFVLEDTSYPITKNTGFVFHEGLSHKTMNAEPRLLVGPMNEFAEPVGAAGITYYPTEFNALNGTNIIASSGYTVQTHGGFSSWRIASNSTGSSPQNGVYQTGFTLNSDGFYNLYPSAPCFLEGTNVLCQVDGKDVYLPIETLKPGTLVKTSLNGYKKVELIGKGQIQNSANDERIEQRLYKCSPSNYPELKEDLFLTGCHSILVKTLTDLQRQKTMEHLKDIFVTDKKYRLIACIDERAEPWASGGLYTIWHLALENTNEKMNYGIYVNGGLLVETCSINTLKNKSNFTLA